ncbi:MAG TPA: FAD-dependent thymidylate synthase [Candidatus Eisenbacteria bacterium]|nr:FAD-dependent thymidylate synthase [Candidatus Eisenbacteria bacterium]
MRSVGFFPDPVVKLENYFRDPFDNSVATARTCYSSRVITSEDVHKDEKAIELRDRIADSIYKAGHHTTIQHPTFQFILDKVSRQFIWSFLHSHPFYNSEQVSQRYVEVKPENFAVPPLDDAALEIYLSTIKLQMDAYQSLIRILDPVIVRQYARIFPNRDPELKRWKSALKKRAQEVARYVLPVATHAHLYHTISGLTLHRYHRLCDQFDTPYEQKLVVRKMVEAVNAVDPLFFRHIEDSIPLERTPEYAYFAAHPQKKGDRDAYVAEFDGGLGELTSRLVDYKVNGQKSMAAAVRAVLGLTQDKLSDHDAIDLVMNPAKNPLFGEALNLTTLGKLARTMSHPHFTFQKKISHTADSQDQRHRMTPASRPVLHRQFTGKPDYIVPALIKVSAEAGEFYQKTMDAVWANIGRLLDRGVSEEYAMYLLPNAFPIRFYESGDLLNHHHKWTKRLCYTAQEEIWNMCRDEVMQVSRVFPEIGKYLLPPCGVRLLAGVRPYCPEGERFCGVPVWKLPVEEFERVL